MPGGRCPVSIRLSASALVDSPRGAHDSLAVLFELLSGFVLAPLLLALVQLSLEPAKVSDQGDTVPDVAVPEALDFGLVLARFEERDGTAGRGDAAGQGERKSAREVGRRREDDQVLLTHVSLFTSSDHSTWAAGAPAA